MTLSEPLYGPVSKVTSKVMGHSTGSLSRLVVGFYIYEIFWRLHGAGDRSRTYDLLITNELLYQLSYTGTGREW